MSTDKILGAISACLGVLLIGGVAFNFLNVILRYGFGRNFSWAEEMLVFGLIFIVMTGSIAVTALNEHLKIDVLLMILPERLQSMLRIISQLAVCAVFVYLAMQSHTVVSLMMRIGQTSVAARIPMWIPHGFLFVSFSLSALAALWSVWREIAALRAGKAAPTTPPTFPGSPR